MPYAANPPPCPTLQTLLPSPPQYRAIFDVPASLMAELRDELARQMAEGLCVGGDSSLLMLPSYVDVLPKG